MDNAVHEIAKRLRGIAEPDRAAKHQKFFKTGKGEYGEGDKFIGVRVPLIRKLLREFRGLSLEEINTLLFSPWHEERLFALLMMDDLFKRGDGKRKEEIYNLFMNSTSQINNWDLVDSSAPYIAGAWLFDRDRTPLFRFAESDNLWERRIAIISTQYFIRRNDFADTLRIAEILLEDREDLIHKAVGWMLREVGNRNMHTEERFLKKHYKRMPRTMLRYAIEKFPEEKRQMYLKGLI
ncbi:MAG: DNA alkylation repair protein [Candidatus Aegiribacteria sp.]|nr:DNA alkylation repair protein [Candidatus Aegiribacteria sp.]